MDSQTVLPTTCTIPGSISAANAAGSLRYPKMAVSRTAPRGAATSTKRISNTPSVRQAGAKLRTWDSVKGIPLQVGRRHHLNGGAYHMNSQLVEIPFNEFVGDAFGTFNDLV